MKFDVEKAQLRNKQVDAFTNNFLAPLPFKVESVEDLKALRRAWLQRESVPCLIESRNEAIDNSFPGLDIRTFLNGDNSSGRISAHDIIVAPGSGLPRHYQTEGELYLSVIEGEIELTVGKLTQTSQEGTFAFIPAHTTAAIENKSKAPARFYMLSYPAGIDRAFAEAHARWVETGDKAAAPYLAILGRFGFHFGVSAPLPNDARTNMKAVRMEADIHSPDDFQAMRENWGKRQPVPKLLHPAKVSDNSLTIDSDGGAGTTSGGVVFNGDETSGHAVMFAGEVGPHYSAFPHYQPNEEEMFYVVSGIFELICGSQKMQIRPGAFGFAPRWATHGFANPQAQGTTRVITVNSPAGHERGFEMIMRHQQKPYADIVHQLRSHGWEVHDPKDAESLISPPAA
ncbi:MAG TPA: cupin domain-containing protein [Rhizomicrobium sp.]|nr:cupin domain-containing protein [Rhizomicrobium sp.]